MIRILSFFIALTSFVFAAKLPMPASLVPENPTLPAYLVTPGGKKILLDHTKVTLTYHPEKNTLTTNYPGSWLVNFPLDRIENLNPAHHQKLFGQPSDSIKNWYFRAPGKSPAEPALPKTPAPFKPSSNPTLIVNPAHPAASDTNPGSAQKPLATLTAAGKTLTSLTSNGTTYTAFDLIDRHEFTPASVAFYAFDGTNGTIPDFATIYTDFDLTKGLANSTGNVFFNTAYDSDDLIFLMEIGAQDNISVSLIDEFGVIISDPLEFTIFDDTGYDLRFRTTNSTTNNVLQDIVGVTLQESDFTNLTGIAAGLNIANGAGNSSGTDFITLGTISQVPTISDPEIAPVAAPNFGTLSVEALPVAGTVTVQNDGPTQNLTLSNATFTGDNPDLFSVATLPDPIAPGSSDTFDIAFDSNGATGDFSATLELETNDPDESTITLSLTANVVSDPEITVAAAALDFGTVFAASLLATQTIIIQNDGVANNLTLSNATITGANADAFSIDPLPGDIFPGTSADLLITFDTSGAAGTFNASLSVETNDADEATFTIPLAGTTLASTVQSLTTAVNDDGFEELLSITTSSGEIPASSLTNVTVFTFTGNVSVTNAITSNLIFDVPENRQTLLEDFFLNTGIINPAVGFELTTGQLVDATVPGLGVRFDSPIPNGTDIDAVFIELTVNADQPADDVSIALLDQNDNVIGNEVSFTDADYSVKADMADSNTIVYEAVALSLEEINTANATNSLDTLYALLELDFSDFGLDEGTSVSGLHIRGGNIDPVFIGGLGGAGSPTELEITDFQIDSENNEISLTFNSLIDRDYALESSTNLIDWFEIEDLRSSATSTTITAAIPADDKVFFRIVIP